MTLPLTGSEPRKPIKDRFNEIDGTFAISLLGATQSIPDNTTTKVTGWTSTPIDNGGGYLSYAGAGVVEVGVDGFYLALASYGFADNPAGKRRVEIQVDGVKYAPDDREAIDGGTYGSTHGFFFGAAGALVSMHVLQNSGGASALDTDTCRFTVVRWGQLWIP